MIVVVLEEEIDIIGPFASVLQVCLSTRILLKVLFRLCTRERDH